MIQLDVNNLMKDQSEQKRNLYYDIKIVQKLSSLRDHDSSLIRWDPELGVWQNIKCTQQVYNNSFTSSNLKIMTLNVLKMHKQKLIFSNQRYAYIYKQIQLFAPDIISLNQVTVQFYEGLKDQQCIKNKYWLTTLKTDKKQGLGNVILTSVKPIFTDSVFVQDLPRPIETIYLPVLTDNGCQIICLCSIHFTAFAWNVKTRQKQFNQLIKYFQRYEKLIGGYVLMGDMNFHSEQENKIYQEHMISDCWLIKHDRKNKPGYTFDAHQNAMINQIYWGFQKRRMRLDRILFKSSFINVLEIQIVLNSPIYSQKADVVNHGFFKGGLLFINDMIGFQYGRQQKQKYLFASDHFGLSAKLQFTKK